MAGTALALSRLPALIAGAASLAAYLAVRFALRALKASDVRSMLSMIRTRAVSQ